MFNDIEKLLLQRHKQQSQPPQTGGGFSDLLRRISNSAPMRKTRQFVTGNPELQPERIPSIQEQTSGPSWLRMVSGAIGGQFIPQKPRHAPDTNLPLLEKAPIVAKR
jgi:hypothetical protein